MKRLLYITLVSIFLTNGVSLVFPDSKAKGFMTVGGRATEKEDPKAGSIVAVNDPALKKYLQSKHAPALPPSAQEGQQERVNNSDHEAIKHR